MQGKMMIVQRVFHHVKPEQDAEFQALMERVPASLVGNAAQRTYIASIGPLAHTVCHELEFANLEELDRAWSAWWADPATPAYMEAYWALVEGEYSEVWRLEE